jgi:hypothetical protein
MMRSATGTPALEYQRPPGPMHGGFWAELFSFSLANPPDAWPIELVARIWPVPPAGCPIIGLRQRRMSSATVTSIRSTCSPTVTVLDWSAALLAPRAYDVAFTSLLLAEPPPRAPGWQRPLLRVFGRLMARRFVRAYQRQTKAAVQPGELSWYQAVVCLRALVDVAGWVHRGMADTRTGHGLELL